MDAQKMELRFSEVLALAELVNDLAWYDSDATVTVYNLEGESNGHIRRGAHVNDEEPLTFL